MAAPLDKILASGHSPLPFLLSAQTESFFSASAQLTHSVTCPASDGPEFAASAYSQPPRQWYIPHRHAQSSVPSSFGQGLLGPSLTQTLADLTRAFGEAETWEQGHICHPPHRHSASSFKGSPPAAPGWEGAADCQLGSVWLAWVGGDQGPHPSCPRPFGSSASPGPHTGAGFARRPPWDSCPGGCCQWPAACPPARGCPSCGSREGT